MTNERLVDELTVETVPAGLLAAKRLASKRWLRVITHELLPAGPPLRVAEAVAFAPQNVHAVGVGRKVVEGVVTDVLSVRFYLVQKLSASLLGPESRIPESIEGEDQIRIEVAPPHPAFGLGGDSGSLVVTGRGRHPVGLYFAGPPSGDYGVANPIDSVLAVLGITLL